MILNVRASEAARRVLGSAAGAAAHPTEEKIKNLSATECGGGRGASARKLDDGNALGEIAYRSPFASFLCLELPPVAIGELC